jgi:hypothetical protein
MSTLDTITTKDAADATATLATAQCESGVEVGCSALVALRKRVVYADAFGVTTTAYASGDVVDA